MDYNGWSQTLVAKKDVKIGQEIFRESPFFTYTATREDPSKTQAFLSAIVLKLQGSSQADVETFSLLRASIAGVGNQSAPQQSPDNGPALSVGFPADASLDDSIETFLAPEDAESISAICRLNLIPFRTVSSKTDGVEERDLQGIFFKHAMMPHSCCPNTISSVTEGPLLIMRASRPIRAGEPFTRSWLSDLYTDWEGRSKLFQERFGGDTRCQCDLCSRCATDHVLRFCDDAIRRRITAELKVLSIQLMDEEMLSQMNNHTAADAVTMLRTIKRIITLMEHSYRFGYCDISALGNLYMRSHSILSAIPGQWRHSLEQARVAAGYTAIAMGPRAEETAKILKILQKERLRPLELDTLPAELTGAFFKTPKDVLMSLRNLGLLDLRTEELLLLGDDEALRQVKAPPIKERGGERERGREEGSDREKEKARRKRRHKKNREREKEREKERKRREEVEGSVVAGGIGGGQQQATEQQQEEEESNTNKELPAEAEDVGDGSSDRQKLGLQVDMSLQAHNSTGGLLISRSSQQEMLALHSGTTEESACGGGRSDCGAEDFLYPSNTIPADKDNNSAAAADNGADGAGPPGAISAGVSVNVNDTVEQVSSPAEDISGSGAAGRTGDDGKKHDVAAAAPALRLENHEGSVDSADSEAGDEFIAEDSCDDADGYYDYGDDDDDSLLEQLSLTRNDSFNFAALQALEAPPILPPEPDFALAQRQQQKQQQRRSSAKKRRSSASAASTDNPPPLSSSSPTTSSTSKRSGRRPLTSGGGRNSPKSPLFNTNSTAAAAAGRDQNHHHHLPSPSSSPLHISPLRSHGLSSASNNGGGLSRGSPARTPERRSSVIVSSIPSSPSLAAAEAASNVSVAGASMTLLHQLRRSAPAVDYRALLRKSPFDVRATTNNDSNSPQSRNHMPQSQTAAAATNTTSTATAPIRTLSAMESANRKYDSERQRSFLPEVLAKRKDGDVTAAAAVTAPTAAAGVAITSKPSKPLLGSCLEDMPVTGGEMPVTGGETSSSVVIREPGGANGRPQTSDSFFGERATAAAIAGTRDRDKDTPPSSLELELGLGLGLGLSSSTCTLERGRSAGGGTIVRTGLIQEKSPEKSRWPSASKDRPSVKELRSPSPGILRDNRSAATEGTAYYYLGSSYYNDIYSRGIIAGESTSSSSQFGGGGGGDGGGSGAGGASNFNRSSVIELSRTEYDGDSSSNSLAMVDSKWYSGLHPTATATGGEAGGTADSTAALMRVTGQIELRRPFTASSAANSMAAPQFQSNANNTVAKTMSKNRSMGSLSPLQKGLKEGRSLSPLLSPHMRDTTSTTGPGTSVSPPGKERRVSASLSPVYVSKVSVKYTERSLSPGAAVSPGAVRTALPLSAPVVRPGTDRSVIVEQLTQKVKSKGNFYKAILPKVRQNKMVIPDWPPIYRPTTAGGPGPALNTTRGDAMSVRRSSSPSQKQSAAQSRRHGSAPQNVLASSNTIMGMKQIVPVMNRLGTGRHMRWNADGAGGGGGKFNDAIDDDDDDDDVRTKDRGEDGMSVTGTGAYSSGSSVTNNTHQSGRFSASQDGRSSVHWGMAEQMKRRMFKDGGYDDDYDDSSVSGGESVSVPGSGDGNDASGQPSVGGKTSVSVSVSIRLPVVDVVDQQDGVQSGRLSICSGMSGLLC